MYYLLSLIITKNIQVNTGTKTLNITPGKYIYVGRAKKNLISRLKRHLKKQKKIRWHIDYLTSHPACKIDSITIADIDTKECTIADILENIGLYRIKDFGSSDCRCKGHLLKRVK